MATPTRVCDLVYFMKPLLKKGPEKIPSTLCQYGKIIVTFYNSEKLDYCLRIHVGDFEFLKI
jgi:hypothetical protein